MAEADALRVVAPAEVAPLRRSPTDAETLAGAADLVGRVRDGGEAALRELGERFGDLAPGDPLVHGRDALRDAAASIDPDELGVLERAAARIESFARAQRASLAEVDEPIPGGRAGHTVLPVDRAGCYAPGGRYPLVSSVLMTAIPARVAGVREVWVASPRPTASVLAAASVAGADAVLGVGGAQAIAALAYGAGPVPACDVVCGPGNRWVTAAKRLVAGAVGIDMLAGPSELLVIADDSADARTVAADLLAQAEHDDDASAVLVTTSVALVDAVNRELGAQLGDLPTAPTARAALANSFAVVVGSMDEAVDVSDRIAPEHLEIHARDAGSIAGRLRHAGALFVGAGSAEVLGDYGAGPNHTLPTGGAARSAAGLSVLTFLRARTWLRMDDAGPGGAGPGRGVVEDAVRLARMEGLEAHARSAERRLEPGA